MKHRVHLTLCAAAALVCGSNIAQPPASQDPDVALLRRDVAQLKAEVAQLRAQSTADPDEVDLEEVVTYLKAQAESAADLQKMLAEAEDKGFTYGINPDSRVAMLAGFNQFTSALQTDVPGAATGEDPESGQ